MFTYLLTCTQDKQRRQFVSAILFHDILNHRISFVLIEYKYSNMQHSFIDTLK